MTKRATGKTVAKTAPPPGTLVPGRNGGKILAGVAINHVPGPGRPPSEVKARALKAFDASALPELERLSKGAEKDSDRIAAANVLAKAGLSDSASRAEVRKALASTIATIRTTLPVEQAEPLVQAIKPFWVTL